jgi:hypothetical protein
MGDTITSVFSVLVMAAILAAFVWLAVYSRIAAVVTLLVTAIVLRVTVWRVQRMTYPSAGMGDYGRALVLALLAGAAAAVVSALVVRQRRRRA